MAKKMKSTQPKFPTHEKDIPVTQEMLYLVRDQLTHKIGAVENKITSFDDKMNFLKSDIASVKSELKSDNAVLNANIASIKLLIEGRQAVNNACRGRNDYALCPTRQGGKKSQRA
jgi:hypothetical protein